MPLDIRSPLPNLLGILPSLIGPCLLGHRTVLVQLRLAFQLHGLSLGELRRARRLVKKRHHDERLTRIFSLFESLLRRVDLAFEAQALAK